MFHPRGGTVNLHLENVNFENYLLLKLCFLRTIGLRISELIGIRLEDVTAADAHYMVRVLGKGQKHRIVKVSGNLVERVRRIPLRHAADCTQSIFLQAETSEDSPKAQR